MINLMQRKKLRTQTSVRYSFLLDISASCLYSYASTNPMFEGIEMLVSSYRHTVHYITVKPVFLRAVYFTNFASLASS